MDWLLLITLMQVYSEKEQLGQKEIKMYSLERKSTSQLNIAPHPRCVLKEKL